MPLAFLFAKTSHDLSGQGFPVNLVYPSYHRIYKLEKLIYLILLISVINNIPVTGGRDHQPAAGITRSFSFSTYFDKICHFL
jgi:hypothetical protein